MSAFTAEHVEAIRLANIAIAEVVPNFTCRPAVGDVFLWPGNSHVPQRLKAMRLAVLATSGPDRPSTCDAHNLPDRPDLWAQCAKVSVASALLGRTCWKAQP